MEQPELLQELFRKIGDLIIEFTNVQIDRIGADLAVMPGHQFPSLPHIKGILLSDDNLAVSSPSINASLAIPEDGRIGAAFGGLVVHSCGNWSRSMKAVVSLPETLGIECAIGQPGCHATDSQPNNPLAVREALEGSDVILKARFVPDLPQALADIKTVATPKRRLIVELPYDPVNAKENYQSTTTFLEEIYSEKLHV